MIAGRSRCTLSALACRVAFLHSALFLTHGGLGCAFAHEPLGRIDEQFLDLLGRQSFCDAGAGEAGCRHTELSGHDESRVGSVQSELHQPLGWRRQQFVQLFAADRGGLEFLGHRRQIDPQLLGNGGWLQGLGRLRGTHPDSVAFSLVTEVLPALRIAFAPGVTVGKWTGRWRDRHPDEPLEVFPATEDEGVAVLTDGRASLSFVRLPIERDGLSVIRLYGEIAVLVVPRDSELAELESVADARVIELANVAEYSSARPVKDAVALVAAGVGFLRLPHSLARLHARKDVVAIPIDGAAETDIAICWRTDETTELVEEFVGIVRGRTEASSRANPTPPTPKVRPAKVAKPRSAKSTARVTPRRSSGKTRKRGSR